MKFIVAIYDYDSDCMEPFAAWKYLSRYKNGENVFYLVEAENEQAAKRCVITSLFSTWKDGYAMRTVEEINDESVANFKDMDIEILGEDFNVFQVIFKEYEGKMTVEQFHKAFTKDIKLKLFQNYMMQICFAFNYTQI